MDNTANVVTIPLDEYFELRTKADMNGTLLAHLAQLEARLNDIDRRMWCVESKVENDG